MSSTLIHVWYTYIYIYIYICMYGGRGYSPPCMYNDMTTITATQLLHIHSILMKDGQGLRRRWPLPVLPVFWSDVREYLASLLLRGLWGSFSGTLRGFWGSSLEAFSGSGRPSWRSLEVVLGRPWRFFRASWASCCPRSPQEFPKEFPRAPRDGPKRPQDAPEGRRKGPKRFLWRP